MDQIRALLSQYQEELADLKQGGTVDMMPTLERLSELSQSVPEGLDPMLKHYLERQSYTKAYDHLSA
ncbi:MAG: hypothetical protein AAFY98_05375 [Verrucomicrobiota bacterium]